jgi:hypothetical protein
VSFWISIGPEALFAKVAAVWASVSLLHVVLQQAFSCEIVAAVIALNFRRGRVVIHGEV